jgi:hypothetical protein
MRRSVRAFEQLQGIGSKNHPSPTPRHQNASKAINTLASTVPSNGDVNHYGVFEVPRSTGDVQQGHTLVSNFNAASNLQGTGTTIVDISPGGAMSLFAQIKASALPDQCTGGVGLTTALVVLRTDGSSLAACQRLMELRRPRRPDV